MIKNSFYYKVFTLITTVTFFLTVPAQINVSTVSKSQDKADKHTQTNKNTPPAHKDRTKQVKMQAPGNIDNPTIRHSGPVSVPRDTSHK